MTAEAIRTEPVLNCPLCGHSGALLYKGLVDRLYRVPGQWNFMRCPVCDLMWLNPRPVFEDIPKCYPDSYFTHETVGNIHLGSSDFKRRLRMAALSHYWGYNHLDPQSPLLRVLAGAAVIVPSLRAKITMDLGRMLLPYRANGRVLDIGCGNGVYLALMKQLGWEVAGVEIDPKAAEVARTNFGITVYVGALEDAPFEESSFDVVTMSHVIEHVPDPVRFLRLAARFLKPDGEMVIVTPNAKSLGRWLFQEHWYALDPPRHLVLFTPRSLSISLEQTGVLSARRVKTLTRLSRKMVRKWLLVRQTGRFRDDGVERRLARQWRTRFLSWAFGFVEVLGNAVIRWGEEIECVAVKA